jgi:hypothetical protein
MHSIFRWTTALLLALGVALTAHADDTAAQIRQHAGEHRLLVLGEFHGTRETPLLVRQLVDDYSRNGPVLLALELPRARTLCCATIWNPMAGPRRAGTCAAARSGPCAMTSMMVAAAATCWR